MLLVQSFSQGRRCEVTVGDGGEVDEMGRWLAHSSGQGGGHAMSVEWVGEGVELIGCGGRLVDVRAQLGPVIGIGWQIVWLM